MRSVNEALHDLSVRHQVNLQRYAAGTVKRIIARLNEADADLVEKIEKVDPSSTKARRLNEQLAAIRQINRDAYAQVGGALKDEIGGLAEYEAGFNARMIGKALPVAIDVVTPSAEQLVAAVMAKPFEGGLLEEWVAGLEDGRFRRLRGAIRMGVVEGETTEQIVRRITGTKALNFRDGILETSRRSAEALTRTALNHAATAARNELYAANDDLVEQWQFVATLDSRTTPQCQALDGKTFPIGGGPMPPRHIRCRSTTVPVVKSWRELGIDLDEAPEGTRASMDGQVPASMTYPEWLAKQSRDVVDDVLGKTRADLFIKGELPIEKFVDQIGRSYTLKELRRRESDAFTKAGVEAPAKPTVSTAAQRTRAAEEKAGKVFAPRTVPGHNIKTLTLKGPAGADADTHFREVFGFDTQATAKMLSGAVGDLDVPDLDVEVFAYPSNFGEPKSYGLWTVSGSGAEISRLFTRTNDGLEVDHRYFTVSDTEAGKGTDFLRVSMGAYLQMGVSRITLNANITVGGYAWSKFGFAPDAKGWRALRRTLKVKLWEEHQATVPRPSGQSKAAYEAAFKADNAPLLALLERIDPRAIWELSDTPRGKQLLLGSQWDGELNLADPVAMKRFTEYVTRRKG